MPLNLSNPYQGRKSAGPAAVSFKNLDDPTMPPIVLAISADSPPTLANGTAITEVITTDRFGNMVLGDQDINQIRPSLGFTFPIQSPTTIGLRQGQAPVVNTDPLETWVILNPIVYSNTVNAGATDPDQEGFGVTADPPNASAGYLDDNGITQPIAIQPYVPNTPPTGPAQIAIGQNMAINISADLVGKYLSLEVPNQVAGIVTLSESIQLVNFAIKLAFVTRHLHRFLFTGYKGILKPDSGDISLSSDQSLQIEYSLVPDGVHCKLYDFQWIPQQIRC